VPTTIYLHIKVNVVRDIAISIVAAEDLCRISGKVWNEKGRAKALP
jgi:hypothetical protein